MPLTTLVLDNEKSRASFDEYQVVLRQWKATAAAASKGASEDEDSDAESAAGDGPAGGAEGGPPPPKKQRGPGSKGVLSLSHPHPAHQQPTQSCAHLPH